VNGVATPTSNQFESVMAGCDTLAIKVRGIAGEKSPTLKQ